MNSATLHVCIQVSHEHIFSDFWGCISRSRVAGLPGNPMFDFLRDR